jgi:hypothetical protein
MHLIILWSCWGWVFQWIKTIEIYIHNNECYSLNPTVPVTPENLVVILPHHFRWCIE